VKRSSCVATIGQGARRGQRCGRPARLRSRTDEIHVWPVCGVHRSRTWEEEVGLSRAALVEETLPSIARSRTIKP
jgi:hypothetical protein